MTFRTDVTRHCFTRHSCWQTACLVLAVALAGELAVVPAQAATISILNADGPGEGFNDPTPRSPVPGNSGTTLGQQRMNSFAAAAAYWANRLSSPVTITVYAQMNPLTCSPSSGTLGSAGATGFFGNFPQTPRGDTWYPAALANALHGSSLDPSTPDIAAEFNSLIGVDPGCLTGMDWWYGSAASAPASTFPFFNTVAHELAHGLGMASAVDLSTGAELQGYDDIYTAFLEDHSTGEAWPQMTDGERFSSARDPGDLHWIGPLVRAAGSGLSAGRHPSGHIQMFAPAVAQPGSSVSHWDTALVPDEMMEPFATASANDVVTTALLKDLGWPSPQSGVCTPTSTTACVLGGRFKIEVQWTDFQAVTRNAFVASAGTSDTALFYWTNPNNWELLIKGINACSLNNKFWIYFAAATNVGYRVTVTDTQTGAAPKVYTNAVGNLAQATNDINAFNCP